MFTMSKYIFKKNEYVKWVKSSDDPAAKYSNLPGHIKSMDEYGYSSGMAMAIISFTPGGIHKTHAHSTFQVYYVLSGKAMVKVGDEERVAEKGAWIFTPPAVEHSFVNIGDEDFVYLLVGA